VGTARRKGVEGVLESRISTISGYLLGKTRGVEDRTGILSGMRREGYWEHEDQNS